VGLRGERGSVLYKMSKTKLSLYMVSEPPCKHIKPISNQLQQPTTKRPTTRTEHQRPREARHISTEKSKQIHNQTINTKSNHNME
jgi:hypothetical protein